MKQQWIVPGIAGGLAFSVLSVVFGAVSLFTEVDRPSWLILNNLTAVPGFIFCGVAGSAAARATGHRSSGAAAGTLAGTIAAVVISVAPYALAYGFIDAVRQYPFEYFDVLNSGAPSIRAFLLSDEGRATVFSTSVGLVPVVAFFSAAVGALVGLFGGCCARSGFRRVGWSAR